MRLNHIWIAIESNIVVDLNMKLGQNLFRARALAGALSMWSWPEPLLTHNCKMWQVARSQPPAEQVQVRAGLKVDEVDAVDASAFNLLPVGRHFHLLAKFIVQSLTRGCIRLLHFNSIWVLEWASECIRSVANWHWFWTRVSVQLPTIDNGALRAANWFHLSPRTGWLASLRASLP